MLQAEITRSSISSKYFEKILLNGAIFRLEKYAPLHLIRRLAIAASEL